MRGARKRLCSALLLAYGLFSLYAAYTVFLRPRRPAALRPPHKDRRGPRDIDHVSLGNEEWNPWEADEKNEQIASQQRYENNIKMIKNARSHLEQTNLRVQIWGKAAIGLYLWQHIFEGHLEPADVTAPWREGSQKAGKTYFRYALILQDYGINYEWCYCTLSNLLDGDHDQEIFPFADSEKEYDNTFFQ